jgi:hypothetical protein
MRRHAAARVGCPLAARAQRHGGCVFNWYSGLNLSTDYPRSALNADPFGNGAATSLDGSAPASLDISSFGTGTRSAPAAPSKRASRVSMVDRLFFARCA